MNRRLSWNQIKNIFEGEWVELTEFDWGWEKTYPRWAKVRTHAATRQELMEQIALSGPNPHALIIYISVAQSFVQRTSPSLSI